MKDTVWALMLGFLLLVAGCDDARTAKTAPLGYSKPEKVVEAYYEALFINDTQRAYSLIWERDQWFVFDDEFRAKYRINTFIYPEFIADEFKYQLVDLELTEDAAVARVKITVPDLTFLTDLMAARLFDASMPPLNANEIGELLERSELQYHDREVTHNLLRENGRWYLYFDFETREVVAEFLRQADRLMGSDELDDIVNAREKYAAAFAIIPGDEKVREGLENAERKISALYDHSVYIQEQLELLDFNSLDYRVETDELPVPGVVFKIVNHGDRELVKIKVRVTFYDAAGRTAAQEILDPLNHFKPKGYGYTLLPGETWQFSQPAFYISTAPAARWQQSWKPGQATAEIIGVTFADEE